MEAKKLALLCRDLADEKKAENIVVLDVRKLSSVTDYFVIATGSSEPHLRAIESEILDTLAEDHGLRPSYTEGSAGSSWVVVDFFDVIIHVMKKDVREKYDLEGLWSDALRVKPPVLRKKVAGDAAAVAEKTAQ